MDNFTQHMSEKMAAELLDPEKVTLHCGIHMYAYGKTNKPKFDCPRCMMVSFMGLVANTEPSKRQETVEMLEYTVHKLLEADKRGEINHKTLYEHPQIKIERDGQTIINTIKDEN